MGEKTERNVRKVTNPKALLTCLDRFEEEDGIR